MSVISFYFIFSLFVSHFSLSLSPIQASEPVQGEAQGGEEDQPGGLCLRPKQIEQQPHAKLMRERERELGEASFLAPHACNCSHVICGAPLVGLFQH